MLKESKAFSGFSVDDIGAAEKFYGQTLGLEVTRDSEMDGILYLKIAGNNNHTLIYNKPNHQPATYTILNFPVSDILSAVRGLKEREIQFESYNGEYIKTDEDNIQRGGGPLISWFKDPAGNFLSVIQI